MPTFNTETPAYRTRPCWVKGRRAAFHRWVDSARPAKLRGKENDPDAETYQLYSVHGIVEYEDGTIERVWPSVIQFAQLPESWPSDEQWEALEDIRDALPWDMTEEAPA